MSSDLFVQFVSYGAFKLTICKKISGFFLLVKSYGNSCSWHFLVSGFTIDLLDSFKETHILWLERTFIKSFLWRPMSYFFSFSHMPYPFPPPHKERTALNVCFQTFPELQHSIGWAGGRTPKYFWRRCTGLWGNPEITVTLFIFFFLFY